MAATALWIGRPGESRQVAGDVRAVLERRAVVLSKWLDRPDLAFNYWDQVSLAEAHLLLGELLTAQSLYHKAFVRHPHETSSHDTTISQAQKILSYWGVPIEARSWLAQQPRPSVVDACRVGVTGHRRIADDPALSQQVEAALHRLRTVTGTERCRSLVVVSALAEGADRLVAEVGLAGNDRLEVALPLELADYATDFTNEASVAGFRSLLAQADRIGFPPGDNRPRNIADSVVPVGPARNAAYERVGRWVADHSDVLLTIWDGQAARGTGGTAEIVEYARRLGRPVVWIKSQPPFEITFERL